MPSLLCTPTRAQTYSLATSQLSMGPHLPLFRQPVPLQLWPSPANLTDHARVSARVEATVAAAIAVKAAVTVGTLVAAAIMAAVAAAVVAARAAAIAAKETIMVVANNRNKVGI